MLKIRRDHMIAGLDNPFNGEVESVGEQVTDPDELAEADPDMEQSPLRIEEQPDDA